MNDAMNKTTSQQQQINPIAEEAIVWRVLTISTFLPICHKDRRRKKASASVFFTRFGSFFFTFCGVSCSGKASSVLHALFL